MWQKSEYLPSLWTCIDLSIPALFVSVWFTKALAQVLCPLRVINISSSQQHPTPIFIPSLTSFFSCDWPLPLTGFVLSLLFSARANLPHRHSFGLLFHPPTLGKTVCSKDCNLTANLYGFLQGRAPSLAWMILPWDVESLRSLGSSLRAEFEGRSFHTYSDAPAVTTGVVKWEAKRCVRLYLFNDDAHYL